MAEENVGDMSKTANGELGTQFETSGDEKQPEKNTVPVEMAETHTFKVPGIVTSKQNEIATSTIEPNNGTTEAKDKTDDKGTIPNKLSLLSPAEQLKETSTPIPYKEPSWGGISNDKYSLEVLKNGVIIDKIDLGKSFYVFGRLQSCDVTMEHPSLSRHHAVLQFSKIKSEKQNIGWYLYDLDSTHGTWINKNRVYANRYYRVHVGHVLKFGGSSRLYILQGPGEDQEEESDLSVTALKEQRERQTKEAEVLRHADMAAQEKKLDAIRKKEDDGGCSWGMADDAIEDEGTNAPSVEIKLENEDLYVDDPKKALKGFYEREGYEEPEYIVTDGGSGKYKCAVELPVDGPNGEPVIAEAIVSGKKKEAVLQCALEGCRILDRMNLLRASTHESRKRKQKNWEDDDFYDSDEDLYLDRTGDIEKKRKQRMKKAGKEEQKTETYKSLVEKHDIITKEIQEIEAKLEKAKSDAAAMDNDDLDALDAYMMAIKSGVMDTKTKMALKRQLMELKQEEMKIRKLVNIAKPASLPELISPQIVPKAPGVQIKLPVIGKIKSLKTQKRPLVPSRPVKEIKETGEKDFIEEEEDEDEEPSGKVPREDPSSRLQGDADDIKTMKDKSQNSFQKDNKTKQNDREQEAMDISQESKEEVAARLKDPSSGGDNSKFTNMGDNDMNALQSKQKQTKDKQKKKYPKQKPVNTEGKITGDYNSTDPDYATWVPPSDQSGDGKTSLNAKLGY
ncbi:Kanadaptin [Mytilus edulis]|uniref:Kanadaptin n=1 Tax=Mytilus edulis TaxID=6550 RepID=A0A8S3UH84_MYTED|nr:Kanadaptin [Mytilus edulis]